MNTKNSILLGCPPFRGYDLAIFKKLIEMGYEVTFFNDIPKAKWFRVLKDYPSIRKKLNFLLKHYEKYNERKILKRIKAKRFQFILIIKGSYLSNAFFENLKDLNPDAKFIMYQWDSLKNYGKATDKNFMDNSPYFDKIYTFDRKDANTIDGLDYMPSFFIDEYANPESEKQKSYDFDLFFIGGNHSNRFGVLEKIYKSTNEQTIKSCFLLLGREVREKMNMNGLQFVNVPISHKEIIEYLKKSNVVIDIHSDNQNGLTTRCFEALAFGKKLATTNALIAQEPFYNPDNIHIIDLENPGISVDFIRKEVKPLDMTAYSLESFLKNLLNN
jgi:hypothetical protein